MAITTLAVQGGQPVVARERIRRWPIVTDADRAAILRVMDSGIFCGANAPEGSALEREFAAFNGSRYCLASNSGTAALHMAVAAAGVQPGDEVITSAFTFVASGLSVLHHNAIPVFADIDPRTYNIDPAAIAAKITPRTRAIIPVHIHGLPADMDEILVLARKHNLCVIEDAAQAHGATYKGRNVGTLGKLGCFSLQASKSLPAGEGGLLVTDDAELHQRAARLRVFGEEAAGEGLAGWDKDRPLDDLREYNASVIGWMYRTTELNAAFTRAQLARLPENIQRARRNGARLSARLRELDLVTPPHVPADRTHMYHKYRVRLHPERVAPELCPKRFRTALLQALRAEGVEVVLWQTVPVPSQIFFQIQEGYGKGCPWTCHHSAIRYAQEEYPETQKLLDNSLVIGSQSAPIVAQDLDVIDQFADAFEKVLSDKDELIRMAREEE